MSDFIWSRDLAIAALQQPLCDDCCDGDNQNMICCMYVVHYLSIVLVSNNL